MKKQIFILVFLVLATFANVTKSYGQLAPRILSCTVDGPLLPSIGATYTYSVNVPNSTAYSGLTYQWFVTKDKSFVSPTKIANATGYDAVVASGSFDAAANTVAGVSITWKTTATPTDPYFLVVNVKGNNGSCDTKNMKIYKIIPTNMFTLDIANINGASNAGFVAATGIANSISQCISDITSITWASTDALNATYDFGANTLIWEVSAANWGTSWTPTLRTSGIDAGEGVTLTWNTAADGTGTGGSFTAGTTSNNTDWTTATNVTSAAYVGATGQNIFIRMVLDHSTAGKQFDGTTDETITLSIDGTNASGNKDVHYSNSLPAVNTLCGLDDGFTYDYAIQTLKARPDVTSNTLNAASAVQPLLVPIP